MYSWCCGVVYYPGTDLDGLETWFWGTPHLPPLANFQLVPSEAEHSSTEGRYRCFYPNCSSEEYKSKQYRDNHFDKIHLGVRHSCDLCLSEFMNPGSVKKHQDLGRCHGTRFGQ
ncbi:hypothetical protein GYMLUDRAFT_73897 [Collybiopsis luxurians FD-317 M1]|uniref:C2H2-type domain-containing protein n=1 Tax=Collybiopsis luxurians FD-317 M1 TaxID=944289 RepID=A0A0D0BXM6_9AGAR|nr:hypothetical protein GYMLUDRAFT_73897 [Collybiopsis luxurians FD-317 M1]